MSLAETLLESQPQKFGLWPSVWKLIRLRVRIMWNGFKRAKLGRKISTVIVLLILVGGMVGLFFLSSLLLRFLQSPELAEYIDPGVFLDAIPTLVLTMAFFLMIMTNFGVLLQSLYLSHDMDFLVTSPLPMRAVFVAKLLEAILPTFSLFCAASLPVLFGMGIASGYNVLYYLLLIIMLALLALAASGMASILVMAVVRVVPARRVAEVLGFLGAIVSILCGQTGNIMNTMDIQGSDVGATMGAAASLNAPWSPLAWAGRGMLAIGRGEWLTGLGLSGLSLLLFGGLFAITLYLAEQLYYTGWSSMQGSPQRKRAPRPEPRAAPLPASGETAAPTITGALAGEGAKSRAGIIPAALRALVVKDFLLLRRDPRNLANLITPLILGFVMLFTTRGRAGQDGENAREALAKLGVMHIDSYFIIALAIFVGWMLMMNLASLAFSREGKSYWMLKSSPIRPWYLLGGKYIVSYLPSLVFSLLFVVVSFAIRGIDLAMLLFSLLVITFSVAGTTAIALAFGVAGANLEWDSPQRQKLSGASGCLMFIAVSLSSLVYLLLFLGPPVAWQIITVIQGAASQPPMIAYLFGLLLGAAAAIATVFIAMQMSVSRLGRIGEVN
jgi:ABC-2 type transport system permease protein